MKKIIMGTAALAVLALILIAAVNAQSDEKKDKKAKSEVVKDCSKCPSAATCEVADGKTPVPGHMNHSCANCDPAKCKEGKCDPECKTSCAKKSHAGECTPAKCHSGTAKK